MAEQSRIALIAVRMAPGPRTGQPQAVVIGTKAPWTQSLPGGTTRKWEAGQDWRYACYPLAALRSLLDPKGPPVDLFDPSLNPSATYAHVDVLAKSMAQTTGLLTSVDQDALAALGFSRSYLDTLLTVPAGGAPLKPTCPCGRT